MRKLERKKMKATYEVNLKVVVIHDVDTLENLKSNTEMANDIATMICDEATSCGAVAMYDIVSSSVNVK